MLVVCSGVHDVSTAGQNPAVAGEQDTGGTPPALVGRDPVVFAMTALPEQCMALRCSLPSGLSSSKW